MNDVVLETRDLTIQFALNGATVHAVNGVSFDIRAGEILGVVGESGSGKSVTALAIMRLLATPPARITGGEVRFGGRDLLSLGEQAMRAVRGNDVSMIFQDPNSALNPVLRIGKQLDEVLEHHTTLTRRQRRARAVELLEMVEIPGAGDRLSSYPHQFSGGMRQRIMIAMALACEPKLLVADEPTTALDVTTQAQVLRLLGRLRRELGMAIMLITHDVGVVSRWADRVLVMYAGRVVEAGTAFTVLERPGHPYTEALVQSVPSIERGREFELAAITGRPPDMREPPANCPFYSRCAYRIDPRCATEIPPLREVEEGHLLASFYAVGDGR